MIKQMNYENIKRIINGSNMSYCSLAEQTTPIGGLVIKQKAQYSFLSPVYFQFKYTFIKGLKLTHIGR